MKCIWCDLGWELGRFGCHYEPLPPEMLEEDGFGYRQQANCTNWAERRNDFYPGVNSVGGAIGPGNREMKP